MLQMVSPARAKAPKPLPSVCIASLPLMQTTTSPRQRQQALHMTSQREESHTQEAHLLQHGAHRLAGLCAGHIDGRFALGAALLVQPNVHHLLRWLEHTELGALGKHLWAEVPVIGRRSPAITGSLPTSLCPEHAGRHQVCSGSAV